MGKTDEKVVAMTPDTERALAVIRPIADELGIRVEADMKFLYCNGQAIGIACNSTWATVLEFIGYAFLKVWAKEKGEPVTGELRERIVRYWFSREQMEMIRKARGVE